MLLIGCLPPGRHTEQHDVYFGIGHHIADILPRLTIFWPEAKSSLHLDAWREVTLVDGFSVVVMEGKIQSSTQLFFLNLGGYKRDEFEEFHYKMLVAANDKGEAVRQARQTAFYRHTGFTRANSHIDEKYGVDVDDFFAIPEILTPYDKDHFSLVLEPAAGEAVPDEIHLGYFKIDKVQKWAPPA